MMKAEDEVEGEVEAVKMRPEPLEPSVECFIVLMREPSPGAAGGCWITARSGLRVLADEKVILFPRCAPLSVHPPTHSKKLHLGKTSHLKGPISIY